MESNFCFCGMGNCPMLGFQSDSEDEDDSESEEESFEDKWKAAGRIAVFPLDSPLVTRVPTIDWAMFPRGLDGKFQFFKKAALAVYNIEGGICHATMLRKAYMVPPGFELERVLYAHPNGIKLPGVEDREEDKVMMGAVLENADAFVIFIRGTNLRAEGIADMKGVANRFDDFPGRIHHGFQGVYTRGPNLREQAKDALQSIIPRGKPVIIAGHSLGAALAHMLTFDAMRWYPEIGVNLVMILFGAPKVGNMKWCQAFEKEMEKTGLSAFRVANEHDPITKLGPSVLGYEHCAPEICFSLDLAEESKDWSKNHIEAYTIFFGGVPFKR